MKKVLATAAALALALLMIVPAFAANSTITGPSNGHKYDIYQIFTGDVEDGKLVNVKYGTGAKDATAGNNVADSVLSTIAGLSGTEGENATALAAYCNFTTVFDYVDDTKTTASLPSGYYLIKDNGKTGESTSLNMIKVISEDLTIEPKTSDTTLDKVLVNENGAKIGKGQEAAPGDKIYFKISVTLSERMDDFSTYKLVISDVLSDTLTFNDDAVIKNGDDTVTANFNKTSGSLVWTCDNCKTFAEPGDTLVLTYSATLGETPIIGEDGNKNSATCKYSNNPQTPTDLGETPPSEVKVYSFNFVVNKVDDDSVALTGATFKLSKFDTDESKYVEVDTIEGASLSTFTFTGLTSGDYKLEETGRPTGYKAIDPIEFTVSSEIADDGVITYSCTDTDFVVDSAAGTVTATVQNFKGSVLPTTGGIGTIAFTVVGAALALGAVVTFVSKKKTESVG